MDEFIIIVMLCVLSPSTGKEECYPLAENPKVFYRTEKECNLQAIKKRKEITNIALSYRFRVTGVYSHCLQEKRPTT